MTQFWWKLLLPTIGLCFACVATATDRAPSSVLYGYHREAATRPDALAPIEDSPGQPRVLFIRDEQLPEDSVRHPNGLLKAWPKWLLEGKPNPAGRHTFAAFRVWKNDSPLQASGLLGPVKLYDFINGIARARGMEQVLMDLIDDNPVYLEIMRARFEFFYEVQRRTLEAAGGLIDFAHAGDDFGNQRGPMISPSVFERHFAPKYGKYFEMVHAGGARTMLHMCGCCEAFLPRLVELGLDVYDVVQPTTPSMDIAVLQRRFGDRLCFCGSLCVQTTLAWGTPQEVEREVRRRLDLFPLGGLFLGPTHAVQVGSPLENILTMYRTAGSLREQVDDWVRSAASQEDETGKINLAKLF